MYAAALVCRQFPLINAPLPCSGGGPRPRCSDRLVGQRLCLERLRLAALADKNEREFFGALKPQERAALAKVLRQIAAKRGLNAAPIE